MTMTDPQTFRVGDKVVLTVESGGAARYPGVWTVEKINPKTIALTQQPDASCRARRLRCEGWMLVHYDPSKTTTVPGVGTLTEVPIPDYFDIGQLVHMRGKPGLYVVIAQREKVNVAPLGGDGGRYWRCHPQSLTKVPLAEAAEEMVAQL